MTIEQDRIKYFWLQANDSVTPTEPEPATFINSKIVPLIDMLEYRDALQDAFNEVGTSADPNDNKEDFIYIANWWLGLRGGDVALPTLPNIADGPTVTHFDPFAFDPVTPSGNHLIDLLKAKAASGVDVRVLGWVSWGALTLEPVSVLPAQQNRQIAHSLQNAPGVSGIVSLNAETMDAVQHLRSSGLPNCVLNTLGHTAGGVHIKGAIIGTRPDAMGHTKARAFTGGLDFAAYRWAMYNHVPDPDWTVTKSPIWHDVQAAIDGPAAQGFYDHYRAMWNEILARPQQMFHVNGNPIENWVTGTKNIRNRTITEPLGPPPFPFLSQHVQSLRTIPAFNYAPFNVLPEGAPASFAPNGIFEVRAAWNKAISGAERLIYIEDQAFWSREIMEWINARIRSQPNLRVIFLMSGASDPNDAPSDDSDIWHEAFNLGLLGLGSPNLLNASQINQIRIFQAWGEIFPNDSANDAQLLSVDTSDPSFNVFETDLTWSDNFAEDEYVQEFHFLKHGLTTWTVLGNPAFSAGTNERIRVSKSPPPPAVGTMLEHRLTAGLTVHSKVMIIDDVWACIGSANVMRRSLYTDWEHSVAFIDDGNNAVREFRKRLWAEHFNSANTSPFDDLDEAIGGWDAADPAWKTTVNIPTFPARGPGDGDPPYLKRITLPFPVIPVLPDRRTELDKFRDPDSRSPWGGLFSP